MQETVKLDGSSVDEALGLIERHTMIVGASRGLGEAVARLLGGAPGARLTLAARSYNRLQGVAMDIGVDRCKPVRIDIVDAESIREGIEAAVGHFGVPRGLVVTVGSHKPTAVADINASAQTRFDQVVRVNLIGPYLLSQQVAMQMAPGSSIVFVGNARSRRGMVGRHAHAAAKQGLAAVTRGMAAELGARGVRVNMVEPGMLDTEMGKALLEERAQRTQRPLEEVQRRAAAGHALRKLTSPLEVAEVIRFLLSNASSGVTGEVIDVSSGGDLG